MYERSIAGRCKSMQCISMMVQSKALYEQCGTGQGNACAIFCRTRHCMSNEVQKEAIYVQCSKQRGNVCAMWCRKRQCMSNFEQCGAGQGNILLLSDPVMMFGSSLLSSSYWRLNKEKFPRASRNHIFRHKAVQFSLKDHGTCSRHAKFKNKCLFCNNIMWFIFNLKRENKQLEIEVRNIQMYINTK